MKSPVNTITYGGKSLVPDWNALAHRMGKKIGEETKHGLEFEQLILSTTTRYFITTLLD